MTLQKDSLSYEEAFLVEAGIAAAQAHGEVEIESAHVKYLYELGKPLVKPNELHKLTKKGQ